MLCKKFIEKSRETYHYACTDPQWVEAHGWKLVFLCAFILTGLLHYRAYPIKVRETQEQCLHLPEIKVNCSSLWYRSKQFPFVVACSSFTRDYTIDLACMYWLKSPQYQCREEEWNLFRCVSNISKTNQPQTNETNETNQKDRLCMILSQECFNYREETWKELVFSCFIIFLCISFLLWLVLCGVTYDHDRKYK